MIRRIAKSLSHQGFPAISLLLAWQVATAAPPVLSLPIDCRLGIDCHIQNYVDRDAGPGWRDYTCGALSYNNHTGTDFRLPDLVAMEAGVNVLAAAAGVVAAVRDGEPDISVKQRGRAALQGKDAGNSVRITHDDGWETQYSHLKRGSVAVRAGQRIEAGAVLGKVGLSGRTEFPHVDFMVRHYGQPVDPFAPGGGNCGSSLLDQRTLWDPTLQTALQYRPTGLLATGFATAPPARERAQAGDYATVKLAIDSPAIVFWIELFGLIEGDVLELLLTGPAGQPVAQSTTRAERNQAVHFGFAGKRKTATAWPHGIYTGRVVLRRGQSVMVDEQRSIPVR